MSLKSRIGKLEDRRAEGLPPLFYHPGRIEVDGKSYVSIEDVPEHVRDAHGGEIIVGQVEDAGGQMTDVFCGRDGQGCLAIP